VNRSVCERHYIIHSKQQQVPSHQPRGAPGWCPVPGALGRNQPRCPKLSGGVDRQTTCFLCPPRSRFGIAFRGWRTSSDGAAVHERHQAGQTTLTAGCFGTTQSIPQKPGDPTHSRTSPTFNTLVPRETSSPHLSPLSVTTSGRQRPDLGGPNKALEPRQAREEGTWFKHHLSRLCTSALASEQMLLTT
jgi:hypothetical protein